MPRVDFRTVSLRYQHPLSPSMYRMYLKKTLSVLIVVCLISRDVVVTAQPLMGNPAASLVFPALASAAISSVIDRDRDDHKASAEGPDGGSPSTPLLLNLVNPCAIAGAVFGAPAIPYVIPCTILRRIRLFRETIMPESQPQITSIANLLSNRQKLLLGNLVMGAVSSQASTGVSTT